MVIIKSYKVKALFNKFPEISGKIGTNFQKFSEGNFPKFPNSQPDSAVSIGIRIFRFVRYPQHFPFPFRFCVAILQLYRAILHLYRAILHLYRAILHLYMAILHLYRAILHLYRAIFHLYRAIFHLYRAFHYLYGALSLPWAPPLVGGGVRGWPAPALAWEPWVVVTLRVMDPVASLVRTGLYLDSRM